MRLAVIFILFFCSISGFSQNDLNQLLPFQDSTELEKERKLLYQQLLSGTLHSDGIMNKIEMPEFNLNQELMKRYSFNFNQINVDNLNSFSFSPGTYAFYPSPFFRNGTIFSGASYKLNDKFNIGGYSFGANSVFTAPFPNQGLNKFDTRGSTFFMEYKVSKKVKIETRVSVSQGPGFY